MKDSTFPLPCELINLIAKAFDIKIENKQLKQIQSNIYCSEIQLNDIFDKYIYQQMKEQISISMAENTKIIFNDFYTECFKKYIHSPFHNFTREDILQLFFDNILPVISFKLFKHTVKQYNIPQILEVITSPSDSSIPKALEWIKKYYGKSWNTYWNPIEKTKKNRLHTFKRRLEAWSRGDDIPSAQHIGLMTNIKEEDAIGIPWETIRVILFICRALDYSRKTLYGKNHLINLHEIIKNPDILINYQNYFESKLSNEQISLERKFKELEIIDMDIKNPYDANDIILDKYDKAFTKGELSYLRPLAMAERAVKKGNLDLATKYYKDAFNLSLYRIGIDAKDLLKKARAVAASLKNPDMVFLRNIKSVNAIYQYDFSATKEGSKSAFEQIEPWEIEEWKKEFKILFPHALFDTQVKTDPTMVDFNPLLEPDYKSPDRVMKIGEPSLKAPQLVCFVILKKYEIIKKLLNAGASVNKVKADNGSAILIALEQILCNTNDDKIFWELAEYEHYSSTLNTTTISKKLLPLHAAIDTGRPEVVRKILELGADPNTMALTCHWSPLYHCIFRIVSQKNGSDNFIPDRVTKEVLDHMRRYSHEISGYDLATQEHLLNIFKENVQANKNGVAQNNDLNLSSPIKLSDRHREILNELLECNNKIRKSKNYLDIFKLLLEYKADVNQKHNTPDIKGYTPLMLAIEKDEVELFQLLLQQDGDITLQYEDLRQNRLVNCLEIANFFNAQKIIEAWPTSILI